MDDLTRLGDPERFIARPAQIKGRMTGAASGILSPGRLAEEELGEVEWGQLMAYMFRRFGAPNTPSDDYKEICGWLLTTPMEGLLLSVRITPSGTSLLFGYMMTPEMSSALYEVEHIKRQAFFEKFGAWCIATHGREPDSWTLSRSGRQTTVEERVAASLVFDEWRTAYLAENPDPVDEDDDLKRAERAIRRTLRDLRRTVGVRDQQISAHGIADMPLREVKRHASSGRALPDYTYDDEMWRVFGAVHRAGGGRKGLAKVAEAAEASYPKPEQKAA